MNLAPPAAEGGGGSAGAIGGSEGNSVPSANTGEATSTPSADPGIPPSNTSSAVRGAPDPAQAPTEGLQPTASATSLDSATTAGSDTGPDAAAANRPGKHSSGGGIGKAWTGGAQLAGGAGFDPVVNWNDGLTLSPGVPLALCYNSEAAAPKPIFLDHYELDPARGTPNSVSAKLTFNGTQYQQYYYDTTTSPFSPGSILQIALQGDARTLATGRYDWRIDVTAHYTGSDVSSCNTRTVSVINRSSSPIGAGWQLTGP